MVARLTESELDADEIVVRINEDPSPAVDAVFVDKGELGDW